MADGIKTCSECGQNGKLRRGLCERHYQRRWKAGEFKDDPIPRVDIPEPNPSGRCMCGCGRQTSLAPRTERRRGYVAGKPMRYIVGHNPVPVRGKGPTHGLTPRGRWHPLYQTWAGMRYRCDKPDSTSYPDYGGRGIRVCDRWQGPDGFANFVADMGERPEGATLDRVDGEGDYEPSNCRWATAQQQNARGRRRDIPRVRLDWIVEAADALGVRPEFAVAITEIAAQHRTNLTPERIAAWFD